MLLLKNIDILESVQWSQYCINPDLLHWEILKYIVLVYFSFHYEVFPTFSITIFGLVSMILLWTTLDIVNDSMNHVYYCYLIREINLSDLLWRCVVLSVCTKIKSIHYYNDYVWNLQCDIYKAQSITQAQSSIST